MKEQTLIITLKQGSCKVGFQKPNSMDGVKQHTEVNIGATMQPRTIILKKSIRSEHDNAYMIPLHD